MTSSSHFDVLIVGAGISGIGAAHYLQRRLPRKTYAILEAREAMGGTWDLFRYPGIRSDSDMQTLGYRFRPWKESRTLADGPSIRKYLRDTAEEAGIDRHIRFNHRVENAEWSSEDARWQVTVRTGDGGEELRFTCDFLFMASGYYRYDQGYLPEFAGTERFTGEVIHPQAWPENLDYEGKRVVVIGSGATAVTLVPAMAEKAGHVTMLQRSPSYIITVPNEDPVSKALRRVLPERLAWFLTRWKNVGMATLIYQLSQRRPGLVKKLIRKGLERQLPEGYDIDTHFKPSYKPWDQRMCMVPDGDLFEAISAERASIVTDKIETFTEKGLLLESDEELEADIIVTATGLNLVAAGGIDLVVDGEPVVMAERMAYKSMMLEGVPNFAFAIGYTNASWTLKVDLICDYVCRLLSYMEKHGHRIAVPENDDPTVERKPLLSFSAGYVQRSIHEWPKQGSKGPWRVAMNYPLDILRLRRGRVDDAMRFSGPVKADAASPREPARRVSLAA